MERNKNYQKDLLQTLENIKCLGAKPRLLLHACCGPCFTIPYEIIKDYFDITIMYNNSNIYPEEEYRRRLMEFKRYIKEINANVKFIECPYDNATYNIDLEPYADNKEGQTRCSICFKKRLSEGYKYAFENGYDYYGTVMTISRYKNAQVINKIGLELQNAYPTVKWLSADFKKNNGYEQSLLIIREHEMYFQEYCGCKYSYQKYLEKLAK